MSKTDKSGIDIYVKAGTKHQSVHIPVIITRRGWTSWCTTTFTSAGLRHRHRGRARHPQRGAPRETKHDGVHTFYIGGKLKVQYVEKHYGEGGGHRRAGDEPPQTVVYLEKGASLQMETTQPRGVDSTKRYTKVVVKEDAEAVITEKLLTHGKQMAESEMDVILAGEGASGR